MGVLTDLDLSALWVSVRLATMTVIVLLLLIIGKSRRLFLNFRDNIMFNTGNVRLISVIGKLLVAFSILTFSLSSLVLSVVLLLMCEIIRSGTLLQEEHDLTV